MYVSLSFINKTYRVGLLFIVILVLADLLTFFYYPETTIGKIFLATREQTPLTWFSSTALMLVGFGALSVQQRTEERGWGALAAIFLFFSLDDATYFHERLSGAILEQTEMFDFFPTYVWMLLYFPLLFFSLCFLIYKLWLKSNRNIRKIILFAVILLVSALCLDAIDGVLQKDPSVVFCFDDFCNRAVTHGIRLTEEVSEVIAVGVLGYWLLRLYCLDKS
jgi:hypothetical protein